MSIQFPCDQCQAVLQVGEELAGRQAKCPRCEALLTIPTPSTQTATRPNVALADATPEEMVQELERRGQQGMLVFPDAKKPAFCNSNDSTLSSEASQPFQLKGDSLGMSLTDFKNKYASRIGDDELPLCSDIQQASTNSSLLTEEWHASAGIVHARIDLPHDNNSPSVAGVTTDLLLYQFVDEQLFRISAFLNTDSFHIVCDALTKKYGAPTSQSDQPTQLTWDRPCSYIEFTRGQIRPKQASLLHFVYKQGLEVSDQRTPKRGDDL